MTLEQQRSEDSLTEKQRKLTEDLRRLQSGLSSEANVRMLDVENVFARMQMLKDEVVAELESEKRQRIMGEEKITTDQSQVRRLLEASAPNSPRLGFSRFDQSTTLRSPILTRNAGDPSYLFAPEGNSSWLSSASAVAANTSASSGG